MTVGDKKSLWGSLGLKEIAQQRTNLEGDPSPDKGSDLFVEGSWLTSDLAQVEWHLILNHQYSEVTNGFSPPSWLPFWSKPSHLSSDYRNSLRTGLLVSMVTLY